MKTRRLITVTATGKLIDHRTPAEKAAVAARFAEQLASGKFMPAIHDGHRLTRGQGTLADQFKGEEVMLDEVVTTATRLGYKPNIHDVYKPALANCVGDPAAFVPCDDPENHVLNVCKARGDDCRGVVNYKAPKRDPGPDTGPPIDEELIQAGVNELIHEDPSLASKRDQVRKEFIDRHSPG